MSSRLDTIAAIATPPGSGGVAIVRVSGREASSIVDGLFVRANGRHGLTARRVYVGRIVDRPGGDVIDEVVVFAMPGPHSYTGEDVVEIQCHGGSFVSQRILESVCNAGARPADPGEFTKRAFLNGRIDLAQAEAVADLIAARSEAGRRLAWSQLDGALSARVGVLREAIVRARSSCEAAIDFADEDIPDLEPEILRRELEVVRQELARLAGSFERAHLRYEGARVVLIGRPNVGKSSLMNALLGRERALVTPIPGTTRDAVDARMTLEGLSVVLIDTAGLRDATELVEQMGIARSRAALDEAECVLAVFDASESLSSDDLLVVEAARGKRCVAVLNKCDLRPLTSVVDIEKLLGDVPIVKASAARCNGLENLSREVTRTVLQHGDASDSEIAIFRARHRDAVERAIECIGRAEESLTASSPVELIASDLSLAAAVLDEISGAITSEDVLDRVFADFCIGK